MAPPFDAGSTSPTDGALKRPDARAADGGEPAHGGEGGSGRDASMPKDATVPKDVFASNDVFVPKDVFAPDDAPVAKDSFVAEAAAPHDAGHDAVSNPCNPGDSLCGGACVDEQTNDANCGGCGLSCSTTCTVGECVVVLASWGSETTPGLGVSSTDVYWASAIDGGESGTVAGANGRILTVPIGGGVTTTLASGQPGCGHLTVHGETAYWNTSAIGSETTGAIVSAPLATGNPSTIVSIPLHANSIAADDAYVYWMNAGLMKASLDGLTVTTLVPSTGGANDLVLSTTNAFWTSGNVVMTVPLAGGNATQIASMPSGGYVAVDATNVYWAADCKAYAGSPGCSDGAVMKAPLAGGTAVTLAAASATAIATDGTSVYWGDDRANVVMKVPTGGGTPVTLAQGLPMKIVVDATSVYWEDIPTSNIMKVTPK